MADNNSLLTTVVGKLPEFLLTFTGFVYATGFLIVYTFFNRFGLKETASEFFKIKYIHVGILFMIFPLLLVIPIAVILLRIKMQRQKQTVEEGERKVHLAVVLLVSNFLLVFYVIIMFAPPDFLRTQIHAPLALFDNKFGMIVVIFALTILGIVSITRIADRIIKEKLSETFILWAQWVLLGIVIYLDWQMIFGMFGRLGIMLSTGQFFIYLIVLISLTTYLAVVRLMRAKDRTRKYTIIIVGFCFIGALYYMSVLAFTFGVYPYISALKGGGDYTDTSTVVLHFSATSRDSIPSDLFQTSPTASLQSKPLIMIEDTATSFFLADPADAGGPSQWRRATRPSVFEVRRDTVATIIYMKEN